MVVVRIPVRHREPLALVASMSVERFEALRSCLGPVDGDLLTPRVVDEIASRVEVADEAGMLLDSLIGAWAFGQDAELTSAVAANEVAASNLLDLDGPQRQTLADRLSSLFDTPTLGLLAHASSLRAEDVYSYCTARILSDLRPMFGSGGDIAPSATIVRHTLKFEVHVDGRIESIVIAVNDRALKELAESVERAIHKGDLLREIAHQAGLRMVDLGETH